ncbi:MAG: DUF6268 family outer membrane beta-barrel protein [Planctomycetes bacterium]|nr:DUF6268 family outer membrane beta-barrel protein [Planctomycetota bacterium]
MRKFWRFVWTMIGTAFLATSFTWGQEQPAQSVAASDAEIPPQAPIKEENAGSRAFGGIGLGGGMGGPGMGVPGYKAAWYPSRPVSNSAADLGLVRQNLSGAIPIWREGGDTVLLMAGVRNTLFFTDAILPDTKRPFPNELWNISAGLMYMHKFDNGWSGGLSTTFGSASDKPFHSIDEMNVGFFGFLKIPAKNERDSWMFSLMYSPVGNLTFPIPGIAYSWKPSDELHVNIGIPFSAMWKPVEDLTLTFSYIPVTNVNARATYRVMDGLNIYGGFEWLNEAYFLADRADQKERFLAFENRLICGVRWDIWTHAILDLNAGYAFDRYYGEGQNQISNLHDRVVIKPGAFLGANLLVKW